MRSILRGKSYSAKQNIQICPQGIGNYCVLSLFSLVLSFDFFARNKETKESTSINYLKAGLPNLRFENDN